MLACYAAFRTQRTIRRSRTQHRTRHRPFHRRAAAMVANRRAAAAAVGTATSALRVHVVPTSRVLVSAGTLTTPQCYHSGWLAAARAFARPGAQSKHAPPRRVQRLMHTCGNDWPEPKLARDRAESTPRSREIAPPPRARSRRDRPATWTGHGAPTAAPRRRPRRRVIRPRSGRDHNNKSISHLLAHRTRARTRDRAEITPRSREIEPGLLARSHALP